MINGIRFYHAPFSAVAVTAAQDLFEVTSSATKITWITGIELSQYTDFGDAQDELLSLKWITGYTSSGSGGSSVTPLGGSGTSYGGVVEINNTTQASGGSPVTERATSWNVRGGYTMMWDPTKWLMLPISTRIVLAQTIPVDSITMNGTIYLAEAG
jgi:hypothetical protein